jgi:ribosomal protein S18 acetylase RimI-like enzyme
MPPEPMAGLTINLEPQATKETIDAIHQGLIVYNRRMLGDERYEPLRLIARDAEGQIVAGLLGELYFDWLYIAVLWVQEDRRGQGIGSRLMRMAEEYAAAQGRAHVHVDTFDFQAPDFYRRLGYVVHGELGPYGDGHIRYYLQKALGSASPVQAAQ